MPRYEVSNDRLGILHGITIDSTSPLPESSSAHSARPRERPRKKREHSDPKPSSSSAADAAESAEPSESRPPKSKRFRFKKKHRSKDDDHHSSRHRSSHHSSSRQKPSYHAPLNDDPSAYDDTYIPNAASWQYNADPDAAFRESLFDAMADDEGAAFWEGVYGQPIHEYPRPEVREERGELEKMDDEEYAEYVRSKMWERSHQHIIEERERRAREKEKERERRKKCEREFERERREERRKERARREERKVEDMRERWEEYTTLWEEQSKKPDAGRIPWPVESGRMKDVEKDAVEEFLRASGKRGEEWTEMVRRERVRWHPDKAMQRWGGRKEGENGGNGGLGEEVMRKVTVVFQTVDEIWNREKGKE